MLAGRDVSGERPRAAIPGGDRPAERLEREPGRVPGFVEGRGHRPGRSGTQLSRGERRRPARGASRQAERDDPEPIKHLSAPGSCYG